MGTFDCIAIGAGPAGVTAAAYLADAGLGVLLVDDRPGIGGAAGLGPLLWATRPFLWALERLSAPPPALAELLENPGQRDW